jgi:hypothetical protein
MKRRITRLSWVFPQGRPMLESQRGVDNVSVSDLPRAWRVEVILHRRSFERSTGYPRGEIRVSFRSDLHPQPLKQLFAKALENEILGCDNDMLRIGFRHTPGHAFRQVAAEKCREVFRKLGLRVGENELPEVGDFTLVWHRSREEESLAAGCWVDAQGAKFWNPARRMTAPAMSA